MPRVLEEGQRYGGAPAHVRRSLLAAVERVSSIPRPVNKIRALVLEESARADRRGRGGPEQRLLFLSLQLDTYQKLAGRSSSSARSRMAASARLRTAALSAQRRVAAR